MKLRISVHAMLVLGVVALASASMAQDKEPLKIKLPEEYAGGTPVPYFGTHFTPYDYKDRPPFMAPKGTKIISIGKKVTSSVAPISGDLQAITDGKKGYQKTNVVELPKGFQWVQIDLGAEKSIYAILVWHFHEGRRVYFDVIGQVSNDPTFKKGVTTVFNNDYDNSQGMGVGKDNEYEDSYKGLLVDAKGVKARYVRFYSNGNTTDDNNQYIEIEVWGK